jgi:hypothetical protein
VTRDWLAACILFGAALLPGLLPAAAHAFSEPKIYGDPAETGGGGGRWFTGSPADGYGCAVCHSGGGEVPLHITGLPVGGYVPGTEYIVKLNWPEVAAFSAGAEQRNLRPSTGLVAEFVSEDGNGSGEVTLQPNFAMPSEQCKRATAADPVRFAATMFSSGAPTADVLECSTSEKNERCLISIHPCGSSELRLVWKAPAQWSGPIWFAAGFVTTENASSAPNDNDYVTELVVPMNAASDGPLYETSLEGGCSVQRVSDVRAGYGLALYALAVLGLLWRRRFGRRSSKRPDLKRAGMAWLGVLACLVVSGCAADERSSAWFANVGLYTPRDAGAADSSAPMLDCMNPPLSHGGADDAGPADMAGSLAVAFTSNLPHGDYDKEPTSFWNAGAVWIEDDQAHYVKLLEYWIPSMYPLSMKGYLFTSRRFGCPQDVDVKTGATLRMHQAHMETWNGKDANGHEVPDGNYKLLVELQIDEKHPQTITSFPFMKGRTAWTESPTAASLTGLTLTYTPAK